LTDKNTSKPYQARSLTHKSKTPVARASCPLFGEIYQSIKVEALVKLDIRLCTLSQKYTQKLEIIFLYYPLYSQSSQKVKKDLDL
jgi:hypothetical protein